MTQQLRIWLCFCCGMGLIPGLGTSACHGHSRKKEKKKLFTFQEAGKRACRNYLYYFYNFAMSCRPAAIALTQPLAWEPPNAAGVALKRGKKKEEEEKKTSDQCVGNGLGQDQWGGQAGGSLAKSRCQGL